MVHPKQFIPRGVIPACLTSFEEDYSIDEVGLRKHLKDVVSVDGLGAICINGHAGEVASLTFDEQRRVLRIAREIAGDLPIVAGVFTNSSLEAGRIARMAQDEGAAALLVFPPDILALGGELRPEAIMQHLAHITGASDLPLVVFQFPAGSRLAYPLPTLLEMCHRYPSIRAIKDQYGDGMIHERHVRELAALDKPVNVLTTHSTWLLGSLALGCQGILSGAGSVIANLQVALFDAVRAGDLVRAREINDRIYPTVLAFYQPPMFQQFNRMKEALVALGHMKRSITRPPLVGLDSDETAEVVRLMAQAGLTRETLYGKIV